MVVPHRSPVPQPHCGHVCGNVSSDVCTVRVIRGKFARSAGFTLVEVLVALFIISILAVLSWRSLDGMTRMQETVFGHSDQTLAIQAGLQQWRDDLDAVQETGLFNAVDYNGQLLRVTRSAPAPYQGQLLVVAWALHSAPEGLSWQRWVSQPLSTRGQLRQAWQNAADWAQSSSNTSNAATRVTAIAPATSMQLLYFRNNAWTNPLSSANATAESAQGNSISHTEIAIAANLQAPPDGVRLTLTLSPNAGGLQGNVVDDWSRATLGGTN